MQKNLGDIIAEISRTGSTGILSLSVKNDPSLFKIFFRTGTIYHITHGTCRNLECLSKLSGFEFDAGCFMSGARVDITEETYFHTEEIIAQFRNSEKMVQWDERSALPRDAPIEATSRKSGHAEALVDTEVLVRMENELLNIVGPVAKMLLEKAYITCKIERGVPITRTEFDRLIESISARLPDQQKSAFKKNFS